MLVDAGRVEEAVGRASYRRRATGSTVESSTSDRR